MRVAVIMGGYSSEREISLKTGKQIADALTEKGCEVVGLDLSDNLSMELKQVKPDVAFIALHGRYGEDGVVQGFLEIMQIPYVGSKVLPSALAMNKAMTKRLLRAEGIATPSWLELRRYEFCKDKVAMEGNIMASVGLPVVVKPNQEGSSVGASIVKNQDEICPALHEAFRFDSVVLAEQFIKGTEITVGVLGNTNPEALPVIEITTETGFYDYRNKYTKGLSHHIIPARINKSVYDAAQVTAIAVHQLLGCRGLSRVDAIVSDDKTYVLEINTIPGMTETSLFPDAARHAGIEFPDLMMKLIELALQSE
jgi:D-alanine-D-alanine ligase